jgi:energy-converting hydrogenase A subunit M
MKLIYERDLTPMKLTSLKGVRQNAVTIALSKRLGISRQQMRKILIDKCDLMTLENLGPRYDAAEIQAEFDEIGNTLSLPHLSTATGILSKERADHYRSLAMKEGADLSEIRRAILEEIS